MKNILIFLILVFISCKAQKDLFVGSFNNNTLKLDFYSIKEINLEIDLKAFTYECFNKEKPNLILELHNSIDSIACAIKFNQAILIDQENNMRFMTDYFALENEEKVIPNTNCMEDWLVSFQLSKNKPYNLEFEDLYTSDLMVTSSTKRVKIVYLHKSKRSDSKCAHIIKSNWIKIN